jgi:tetratricopeptide (TPR) repeat protein
MAEEIPTNSWKLLYETGRQALQDRKLQEAEQSFSAALQLAEDFAAGDPRLAATLNALARIYSLQRRYLAAAALLNRLLEVTERTLGPTHVQVAGVLTNLAEMYTHLGAAREELELRERVLSIRGDDPNADATSLQRLRDRVAELRSLLAAQEATADLEDEIEQEPLPTVRTAEYSAPIPTAHEPEPLIVREPIVTREPAVSPVLTPSVEADETYSYDGEPKSMTVASSGVEIISIEQPSPKQIPTTDHGFSDMGRDELPVGSTRRMGRRSGLYSIAAGILLVAGLLAARDYVRGSDDERGVSTGSVSLANAATPPRTVVTRVAQTSAAADPAPDARTVERLIADRRAERETRKANEERESSTPGSNWGPVREFPAEKAPRVPTAAELDRALKSVDGAVKAIEPRTKAATDSALAIKVQAPTFKKIKMAENTQPER